MNRPALIKKIYELAYLKGDFTLRSGETSNVYFDKYQFESDPEVLNAISGLLAGQIIDKFDLLAGLEMGGIPIATAMSLNLNKAVVFVRKESKTYGTCKLAEGPNVAGKKLIIIEDVVSSGGAVVDAVTRLRELGAVVESVFCIIERDGSGRKNLHELGLRLTALFTQKDLELSPSFAGSTK